MSDEDRELRARMRDESRHLDMARLANTLWLALIVVPIGYAWFEGRRLADGTVPGWWPWAWPSIPQMVAAVAAMFVAQRLAHAAAER